MTPVAGLEVLSRSADVLLCDVFGTIHDAHGLFPAALDALSRFRAAGGFVLLVSNSALPASALASALAARGVPEASRDAVLTSADVARDQLARRGSRLVHHIGAAGEARLFDGLPVRLCAATEAEIVVCTGWPDAADDADPADAADALLAAAERRLDLLCTNPDTFLVVGDRTMRFAGAVAERYAALGGRVVATGKPDASIYEAAIALAASRGAASDRDRILAIGDSFHLDVAGARGAGLRALWIGQGETPDREEEGRVFSIPALAW